MTARALMLLGTASHVGKSMLTTGLGRIFSDDGVRVAPFKAQNMSLNSAATPDGSEIGRAQALQAEACRAIPCAEMNPVLIKPCSDTGAQVILRGRVWGQVTASDYHQRRVEELFPAVIDCYRSLAAHHELMLLEGAGSPAEINLREHDIVNMRMAHAADANCLLIGDIDRGGVFASLLGTMELLEPVDRARIQGFIINKFRGDLSLLAPGIAMIERRLGIPCAGIVPYLHGLGLDEEDSVAIEDRRIPEHAWREIADANSVGRRLRIAVIALPHVANFTDFDSLAMEPSVSLAFVEQPNWIEQADVVVLPGSKQTLDDLAWLHKRGFTDDLRTAARPTIGVCGGFQMLGISIEDPFGVESGGEARAVPGLGLLAIRTIMNPEKTVRRVTGHIRAWDAPSFTGYEIHMGETRYEDNARPFAEIRREGVAQTLQDGAIAPSGRIWGSYVHGLFDDDAFRHAFLDDARKQCGLVPAQEHAHVAQERQARIDRWADHLRQALDLKLIRRCIARAM